MMKLRQTQFHQLFIFLVNTNSQLKHFQSTINWVTRFHEFWTLISIFQCATRRLLSQIAGDVHYVYWKYIKACGDFFHIMSQVVDGSIIHFENNFKFSFYRERKIRKIKWQNCRRIITANRIKFQYFENGEFTVDWKCSRHLQKTRIN